MVSLGFGKFVRSDRIFALEPLVGDERGDGQRTKVWIEGVKDPIIAARTEVTILRDMGQEAVATEAPLSMRPWIWHHGWLPLRKLAGSTSMILDAEPGISWPRRPPKTDSCDNARQRFRSRLSLPILPRRSSIEPGPVARPEPACVLSVMLHPVSGLRLRSLALIHIWRPSGPRTRPHHSLRSRTQ